MWLSLSIIATFVEPSIVLLLSYPRVKAIKEQIMQRLMQKCSTLVQEPTLYEKTLAATFETQETLVKTLNVMLTITTFGSILPPLMMFCPLWAWLQRCAWVESSKCDDDITIGERLAIRLFVHKPVTAFALYMAALMCVVIPFIKVE